MQKFYVFEVKQVDKLPMSLKVIWSIDALIILFIIALLFWLKAIYI